MLHTKIRMDISHNGEAMTLRPDVVQKAVKDGIELWLFNTVISNREELHNLLTNELALDEIWVDSTKSYACRNLDKVAACVGLGGIHGTKSMSPNLFLPLDMCGCRPGYAGTGTNCSVCPGKHLQQPKQPDDMPTLPTKSSTNQSSYQLATTKEACRCSYGLVGEQNSELICQCPQNEALSKADDGEHCVHCSKHHPQCLEPGATVSEAAVERGYF